ncbi:hypothetical protein EYC84_001422 [Monilinia fructicola]|uniref:Uncharacterized protein n=1 Tax=Monilinia fructicola TaxID=38448 RepID=A0A5M9JTM6_MONFR|nr:hypothetical protein EYC84_001422 [Monilinia fructicola]
MMEFFDHLQALVDKLHNRTRIFEPHSQAPSSGDDLNEELDELKRYLSTIYARLHKVESSSRQNEEHRSSGNLIRILISIHRSLQETLHLIEKEDSKSHHPDTKVYAWKPETLSAVVESIVIENHKLRVLLCTFDPDASVEALLFGILTELETEYLNPDVVQERTKTHLSNPPTPQIPPTPPLVQDRQQSISTGSTQSIGIDEYGVVFKCHLGGEQTGHLLKVRVDAVGALFLDFDEEAHLWPKRLQDLREVNLLRASILPNYLTPDVHIKRGIKLRTLERFQFESKNAITGRLQIWLKDFGRGFDSTQIGANSSLRRASTSFSTTSRTTFSSIATLKAREAIPGSHLTTIDEGSGLSIDRPIPPLVIMFVESSSKDKNIQRGQILAFKFEDRSKLDRKKCKPDDKFPRCFVLHAVRVDLAIGPLKFPENPKELSWIEISFSNDEEREIFTKQLEDARKIYNRRMEQHNKGMKFLHQGHHNTKDYSAD